MSIRFRGVAALLLATLFATAMSACSASTQTDRATPEPNPTQALPDDSAVIAEYRQAVKDFELSLPDGGEFPSDPPAALLEGSSLPGAAGAPVYFYWLCSWEVEYLDAFAVNDSEVTADALEALDQGETTRFARTFIEDPDQSWRKYVLEPALLGDPGGVRDDAQSCRSYGFVVS